ncbi:MAG: DUF3857 domain-containing protein [Bacteroidota bacterium]
MFCPYLSLTVLLFCSTLTFTQDVYQDLEWGEISPVDLHMTVYSKDSTAQAVVLGDQGYVVVGYDQSGRYEYVLRRHRRVKILHEAAVDDYGDVQIYFYHKDRLDNLRNINAQTIAPDGTVASIKKDDVYFEQLNEYWSRATFSFPNVAVGSVLEYRYVHESKRLLVPDEWTFREPIPVRSSYYTFACNVPLVYSYLLRGAEYMDSEVVDEGQEIFRLEDTEIHVNGASFWMKNGAAVKEEPFMTTVEDYYIKVRFQASEEIISSGYSRSFYSTWKEACRDLLNLDNLGGAFSKKRYFKNLLEAAQSAINTEVKQSEIVYQVTQFIAEQIKWSGRRGVRTDITLDEAFARHEADLPEIQYAGLVLLREFGIEAHPVLLSTRDNGAMIRAFPFLDQFNYVILLVEVDGHEQLLDLSDPLLRPGVVQVQALNSHGFLLDKDRPQWIDLDLPVLQDVLVWRGLISSNGLLKGDMTCTFSTFSARNERLAIAEDKLNASWSDRLPEGGTITGLEVQDVTDLRKPLKIQGQFEVPNAGFVNDDFLYLTPTIYARINENPFTLNKRDYPIDFPYPFEEKSIYTYDLPEDYVVESLPESLDLNLPNGDASLHYLCQEKNGKVNMIIQFRVQKTLFPPEEYPALRDLFEELENKMQEQIVLRKTETSN